MRKLSEQFPKELVVIGVHSGKFPAEHQTESIRQAVMRLGIEHPVVNDAENKIWNSFTVNAWPTLVLIDPRGRIAGEISGEILANEFAPNIQEVIDQHPDLLNLEPLDLTQAADSEPERPLRFPARLLISDATMFIADTGHHRVLEVKLDQDGVSGEIKRVFGTGVPGLKDGVGKEAQFSHPHGLGLKGSLESGTLYVADTENNAVRAIDLGTEEVRTVAGNGQKGHGRQVLGGAAVELALRSPWAVVPLEQYVLVAMAGSHQIWVLIDETQIGPFAGTGQEALVDGPIAEASFNQPSDLSLGMGHLFVADAEASAVRAISLGEQPQAMTLVGQGLFAFGDQDGPTSAALLQHPAGLAYADRLVYVADTYNNKIKVLDPFAGQVQTLIGSGQAGWQDGPFESARLFEPEGVQVHVVQHDGQEQEVQANDVQEHDAPKQNGLIYIADTNNHLIRVADMEQRQLHTFRLRGLDRLIIHPPRDKETAERLPEVTVSPGRVNLSLDVQLPPGYERNPDALTVLRIAPGDFGQTYTFNAQEAIHWSLDVDASRDLLLEVTVYYCRETQASLCLISSRRVLLPVRVTADGPREARVAYSLPAAEE